MTPPVHLLFCASHANSELVESVNVTDPGISSHTAVHFTVTLLKPPHLTKNISFQKIKSISSVEFVDYIATSPLISQINDNLNDLTLSHNSTLLATPDLHAPLHTKIL